MKPTSRFRGHALATFIACLVATTCLTGCSTLSSFSQKEVPVAPEQASATGQYRVEAQIPYQKPNIYTGTIDGPITVQTALEESGAIERFRNMDITVLRVVKDSGRGLKMAVDYEPRKKAVVPRQDYAIHPGDRIIVEPRSNSILAKMLDSVAK